ncbi:MAG: nickel-binding protein [Nitrososphaeraceae archaeon]
MPSIDNEKVQELIGSKDEFDVTPINILFNREADLCYCLQEAPNKKAVEKHHSKFNLKCEWIMEVTLAKKIK